MRVLREIALWTLFSLGWLISIWFVALEFGEQIGGIFAGLSIMALALWLHRRWST